MKATKKIVGAACALVAAVALSAGSTFAWFTSNADVSVAQIDAKVVTLGGDLQIAVKSQTYVEEDSKFTEGDLGAYSYSVDNPFGTTITPVLTAVTSTDGKSFSGRGTPDATGAIANTTSSSGGYVKFTISLRSSTAMHVYLASSSSIESSYPDGVNHTSILAWKEITATAYGPAATTAIAQGEAIEAKAENACRVAFVMGTEGNKIWAPYEETEFGGLGTAAGFSKGNLASDYEVNAKGGNATAYTNVTTEQYGTGKLTPITPGSSDTSSDDTKFVPNNLLCDLEANTAKEITICMWIEGRDGDCFNSIFSQLLSLNLTFHGVDIDAEESGD